LHPSLILCVLFCTFRPPKRAEKEKAAWEKSIGYLDVNKKKGGGLGVLVRKKSINGPNGATPTPASAAAVDTQKMPPPSPQAAAAVAKSVQKMPPPSPQAVAAVAKNVQKKPMAAVPSPAISSNGGGGGGSLGLLGSYSDSDSGSD
jgi:hypothetical protein